MLAWVWSRAKIKIWMSLLVFFLILLIMSRPLFYVVLTKTIALSVRIFLRRSCGILIVLIDAILDEAATQLETGLISPPQTSVPLDHTDRRFEMQQQTPIASLLWNGLFTLIGVLLGHRLPRHIAVRNLRLV